MSGRTLLVVALASTLASCSKAESKKSEPAPEEAAKTAPAPTPQPDDVKAEPTPEGTGEPVKIEPVQVQVKGVADPKQVTPEKGPGPAPEPTKQEPAPGAESDASFQLTVEQPAAVAAGGETTLRVRVTPGTGYKMNAEFPTKLTLEPTAGVTLGKTSLVLADAEKFDDGQLVFAVKATPAASGSYTVNGKIKFAVCTDATCDPKKRNVAFAVTAK
jgi:hypothetical protein